MTDEDYYGQEEEEDSTDMGRGAVETESTTAASTGDSDPNGRIYAQVS